MRQLYPASGFQGQAIEKLTNITFTNFNVELRLLLRTVLGAPPAVDWACHDTRLCTVRITIHLRNWCVTCFRQYWRFASDVARLPPPAGPDVPWSGMARCPGGPRNRGFPQTLCEEMFPRSFRVFLCAQESHSRTRVGDDSVVRGHL